MFISVNNNGWKCVLSSSSLGGVFSCKGRRKGSQNTVQGRPLGMTIHNGQSLGQISKSRQNVGSAPNALVREKKAARQLGVIVGAFIGSWLPYFTLFMVILFFNFCFFHDLFIIYFCISSLTLSPFMLVYIWSRVEYWTMFPENYINTIFLHHFIQGIFLYIRLYYNLQHNIG